MIQVKTFLVKTLNHTHLGFLDENINTFIKENDIEVVDVKYDTCASVDSGGHRLYYPSAMLIYKTKK